MCICESVCMYMMYVYVNVWERGTADKLHVVVAS